MGFREEEEGGGGEGGGGGGDGTDGGVWGGSSSSSTSSCMADCCWPGDGGEPGGKAAVGVGPSLLHETGEGRRRQRRAEIIANKAAALPTFPCSWCQSDSVFSPPLLLSLAGKRALEAEEAPLLLLSL